jgi:hypothetical protein
MAVWEVMGMTTFCVRLDEVPYFLAISAKRS